MIYATIQYMKEDESGLYPARNFVDVSFYGEQEVTEKLGKLFGVIKRFPQDIANAELQIIAQKEKETREKVAEAFKEKRGLIHRIKKLYKEYEPTEFSQRVRELNNVYNTSHEIQEIRNMLASLEFRPGATLYSPDGVFVAEFAYEGNQESLLQRIDDAIEKYDKLKQSHILGLRLKYGVEVPQVVAGEDD